MKRILLVEDDAATAAAIEIRLRDAGYQAWVARDAITGFSQARQHIPNLILLDLTVPGGNGLQLVERFRGVPELAAIPVVLITANTSPECRARAMELNTAGFLEKPYDASELLAVIRFALGETVRLRQTRLPAPITPETQTVMELEMSKASKRRRVLVVEDDIRIATALAIRLKSAGYAVVTAQDALTGVSAAVQNRPDLVLLDLSLPAGDGFVVAERIRSNVVPPPPIIFLTASKQFGLRERAASLRAAGFFEKPYEAEALLTAVRQAVDLN